MAFTPGLVPGQLSVPTSFTRKPVIVARPTHPKIYGIYFDDHIATRTEYKKECLLFINYMPKKSNQSVRLNGSKTLNGFLPIRNKTRFVMV